MSKVISLVVENDLCTGCGLCTIKCPSNALKMGWNNDGFMVPELISACDDEGDCISVCPFNPFPTEEVKTESELSDIFLEKENKFHPKIGKYNGLFVGYSITHRLTSSSGGMATYFLTKLLETGFVNHVISVKESNKKGEHYDYIISSSCEELSTSSKTRYFPVTLAEAFNLIKSLDGYIAIVGIACFLKAIRLTQHSDPILKDKIRFLSGIICGGLKSSFFTEFLSEKVNIPFKETRFPQYRIKDHNSSASDYSFGCTSDSNEMREIKMKSVGEMWGTGQFKCNACDFCDDVTTELSDVSFGDAWMEPYNLDGLGTNVIVTRSKISLNILKKGIENKEIEIKEIGLDVFLSSQQGSFNHRHIGLPYRIKKVEKNGVVIPPKRFNQKTKELNISMQLVQYSRMVTRKKSLEFWRNKRNIVGYEKSMKKYLLMLRFFTKINHIIRNKITSFKK
jgi:coenzyme F420 hydrogenase subunit beta